MNNLVTLLPVVSYKIYAPITDIVTQGSCRLSPEAVFHHSSLSEGAPWHQFQPWDGFCGIIDDCSSICCASTNDSMTSWFTSPVLGDCKRCVLKATKMLFLYLFRIISSVYVYYSCQGEAISYSYSSPYWRTGLGLIWIPIYISHRGTSVLCWLL